MPAGLNKKDAIRKAIELPDCTILDSWIFDSFILTDEPFANALGIFKTCVLV